MTWNRATGLDVSDILQIAETYFEQEPDFDFDSVVYAKNLTHAVVDSMFSPNTTLVVVKRDGERLLGYSWVAIENTPWSGETFGVAKIAHVALDLSPRQRIQLLREMLNVWYQWATEPNITVLASTSIRDQPTAFLKLHEREGYTIRGAVAYKRVIPALNEAASKTSQA